MENEHLKKGALVFQGFLSLFPAYAGVIPQNVRPTIPRITFPRIRGGDPGQKERAAALYDFSPHTRG